jgi:hypothetical protein
MLTFCWRPGAAQVLPGAGEKAAIRRRGGLAVRAPVSPRRRERRPAALRSPHRTARTRMGWPISPYKRGVTGSNPVAPTRFLQLDGLFETLIGDPVTTAGNHRCMLPDGEGCPAAMAASPSTTTARRAPTAGTTGTGAARRAEGSAASGLAHACLHRGEPDGWRAPRGSPGDRVGGGCRPDGNPPSVAVLRADRAGGDTRTPRSRRALKLAQMAVGALREWQVD